MKYAAALIEEIYREQPGLKHILIKHSDQVRLKALEIAENSGMKLDMELIERGAMLHDIGIICCHAPDILCRGELPYICHGIRGAELLRSISAKLEAEARICERHTGCGLSAADITGQNLPLPPRNFLPETPEEKLICLADKFFSKSGDMQEKSFDKVRRSMARFGQENLERFNELCSTFNLNG